LPEKNAKRFAKIVISKNQSLRRGDAADSGSSDEKKIDHEHDQEGNGGQAARLPARSVLDAMKHFVFAGFLLLIPLTAGAIRSISTRSITTNERRGLRESL